jgi:hypothetical protein
LAEAVLGVRALGDADPDLSDGRAARGGASISSHQFARGVSTPAFAAAGLLQRERLLLKQLVIRVRQLLGRLLKGARQVFKDVIAGVLQVLTRRAGAVLAKPRMGPVL